MEEGWSHFEERKSMVKNQEKSIQCLLSNAQLSPAYFYPNNLTWTYINFFLSFFYSLEVKTFSRMYKQTANFIALLSVCSEIKYD